MASSAEVPVAKTVTEAVIVKTVNTESTINKDRNTESAFLDFCIKFFEITKPTPFKQGVYAHIDYNINYSVIDTIIDKKFYISDKIPPFYQ